MSFNSSPAGLTCTHHELIAAGARMEQRDGWMVPLSYGSHDIDAEIQAALTAVGIAEQGHLAKFRLLGPGTGDLLNSCGLNLSTASAAMIDISEDDLSLNVEVARLSEDEAWVTGPAGSTGRLSGKLVDSATVSVFDVTGSQAGMRLVGPSSRMLLSCLTELDLRSDSLPDGGCAQAMVTDVPTLVMRAEAGQVPSYRLFFGREYGLFVHAAILEAGRRFGMVPIGEEALTALGCKP